MFPTILLKLIFFSLLKIVRNTTDSRISVTFCNRGQNSKFAHAPYMVYMANNTKLSVLHYSKPVLL